MSRSSRERLIAVIFGETSAITGENVMTWFGLMEDNIIKEFKDQQALEQVPVEPGIGLDQDQPVSDKNEDKKKCKC